MVQQEHATAELVAGVWQDVLSGPVDLDDDFFALGGDSIKASQIVVRLRRRTQAPLSLAEFLAEVSTPRELAALLRART